MPGPPVNPLPRPVSLHDVKDTQRLYEYLSTLERKVREQEQRIADLTARSGQSASTQPLSTSQLAQIQSELSADGDYPLPLTGLSGDTATGQTPKFASGTSLPDPISTVYDSFVVTGGTYDNLYRLNRDANPHAWVQIATFPAGSLMTLDTAQVVTVTGTKTIDAAWLYEVAPSVINALDANLIFLVQDTNATGTAAAGQIRAKGDTSQVTLIGHGTGRTLTRCGITLGGWTELLTAAGNGLLIDVNINAPLVFGTNSTERVRILGTGQIQAFSDLLLQMVGAIAANTTQLEIKKSTADGGASVFKIDYEGDVTANDVTIHDLIQTNGSIAVDSTGTSFDVNGLDASTATKILRVLYAGSPIVTFDGTGALALNSGILAGGTISSTTNVHADGDLDSDGNVTTDGHVVAGSYVQIGSTGKRLYTRASTPNGALTGNSGDFCFRTDTPGTALQNLYVCTGGTSWTALI